MGMCSIGCCPAFRRLTATGDCIAVLDDYALHFNLALAKVLEQLGSKFRGMKYSFGDEQTLGNINYGNPSAYGN